MSCVRWSQGLIFHQAVVDCARAAILLPMGRSIFLCEAISKCALVETTFLLLVTVSTVNLLTTVLNDAPILPDEDSEDTLSLLKDSPQCVSFGLFMIWFSSITINLGPTFLSGALAANADAHMLQPSCPLVQVRQGGGNIELGKGSFSFMSEFRPPVTKIKPFFHIVFALLDNHFF